MPDITLCSNPERCAKKKDCYRATAKGSMNQSYADFYQEETCNYFIQRTKDGN